MSPAGARIISWEIIHDTEIDHSEPPPLKRISLGGRVKVEWAFDSIEEAQAFSATLPIPEYGPRG